jgi:hypothetical protein
MYGTASDAWLQLATQRFTNLSLSHTQGVLLSKPALSIDAIHSALQQAGMGRAETVTQTCSVHLTASVRSQSVRFSLDSIGAAGSA